jgi:hypothetical protein
MKLLIMLSPSVPCHLVPLCPRHLQMWTTGEKKKSQPEQKYNAKNIQTGILYCKIKMQFMYR